MAGFMRLDKRLDKRAGGSPPRLSTGQPASLYANAACGFD